MIYEQRIYHVLPGRMPDLLKRFEKVTLPIWDRFGIQQVGFWITEVGASNHDLINGRARTEVVGFSGRSRLVGTARSEREKRTPARLNQQLLFEASCFLEAEVVQSKCL